MMAVKGPRTGHCSQSSIQDTDTRHSTSSATNNDAAESGWSRPDPQHQTPTAAVEGEHQLSTAQEASAHPGEVMPQLHVHITASVHEASEDDEPQRTVMKLVEDPQALQKRPQLVTLGTTTLPEDVVAVLNKHRALLEDSSQHLALLSCSTGANKTQACMASLSEAANKNSVAPLAVPSASGRRMMAANITQRVNVLKVSSRVSLLSSDAWNIAYGALMVARAGLNLLGAWFRATATGVLHIDNTALLEFSSCVADLNGELSDTISKITKLHADASTP